jgi:hypothetical protein
MERMFIAAQTAPTPTARSPFVSPITVGGRDPRSHPYDMEEQ